VQVKQSVLNSVTLGRRPTTLQSLPLTDCMLDLLLIKWQSSNYSMNDENRRCFVHQGMIDLGREVIRMDSGSTSIQQSTLVHLSTNSIQYYRKPQPDGTSILLQLQCDRCNMIGTVPHLTNCQSSIGIKYRNELHLSKLYSKLFHPLQDGLKNMMMCLLY
jgi:hypothetical protein